MLERKSVISKSLEIGSSTLMSRMLGIIRETLIIRYLGVGVISDAFFTAFKIPNSLRKIFAEGALSASFIPTFVTLGKTGSKDRINNLMTLSFVIIQSILIALCLWMFFHTELVLKVVSPGWFSHSHSTPTEAGSGFINSIVSSLRSMWHFVSRDDLVPLAQVEYAQIYLKILLAFIVFLSSASLLAGALQSVGHFFVPAFAPVLLNIVFITGLLVCIWFGLSVKWLCAFIIAGGAVQFIVHWYMYKRLGFKFGQINWKAWEDFKGVMHKFLPCFLAMSVMEIGFFVDSSIASFLPTGSISMISYAFRFMGIPLGVFVTALSTVLLPYFAHIRVKMPERMPFFLYEASKLYFWITLPMTLVMMFFSEKLFVTLFLSSKFTLEHVYETSHILNAYLLGLFIFACNKLLLNIYYAMHDTKTPMYLTIFSITLNAYLSYWVLMEPYGATGIALATTISAGVQALLSALLLQRYYNFGLYFNPFAQFVIRYSAQVVAVSVVFVGAYTIVNNLVVATGIPFFSTGLGFWLWAGPLAVAAAALLYFTRKQCGIKLYFID